MNANIKSGLTATAACLVMMFATPSANAITVTDPLNTLQNLMNNLQDIETRIYDEIQKQAERALQKELSKVGLANEAAQSGQEIQANQRLETNLRNQEIAQEQEPLIDVCKDAGIISLTLSTDLDCYRDTKTQDAQIENQDRRNSVLDLTQTQAEAVIAQDSEDTVIECTELLREGSGSPSAIDSYCFDSRVLTDSNVTTIQTGIEEKGAEKMVQILTEPTIRPKAYGSNDFNTPEGRKKRLNEHRKDMLIELAQSVLLHNVEMRRSSKWADSAKTKPIPSKLEALDNFNNNRFLSENGEYLLKLGAAHADKSNGNIDIAKASSFNIDQVTREMAVMDAFLVYINTLQYKSLLRLEQLEAASLSIKANPLD